MTATISTKLERITALGPGVGAAMSLKDPSLPSNYSHRLPVLGKSNDPHAGDNLLDFIRACWRGQSDVIHPHRWPHLSRVMVMSGEAAIDHDPRTKGQTWNPRLPVGDNPDMPNSCDGLVTRAPNCSLLIQTADCPPLLLHDPVAKTIAAIHCGWKPVAHWIVPDAIAVMKSVGSHPSDIIAWIGPSGGDDEYEFHIDAGSEPLLRQTGRVDDFRLQMTTNDRGIEVLSVSGVVQNDLLSAGLKYENITRDPRSTIADETLHSFRRDGSGNASNSAHGLGSTMIWLEP